MEKTELMVCPMTADEAIRILAESNELLVGQMARLSELIGEMENAPERERESWYDSLDHCQREYDAVAFAIDHLRRTPSPDNMPLTEIKTCDLVRELEKREGVEAHSAEPYKDLSVSVNGPAVVLVVID